jgi:oligoendopeptidase, M3 family
MKFSEYRYERVDVEQVRAAYAALTERVRNAPTADEAAACVDEHEKIAKHVGTMLTIAQIRNTIDTRDAFYEAEQAFIDENAPLLNEASQGFMRALYESPFRPALEEKYGRLLFLNIELELKTFKPEIIGLLQEENALTTAYTKLIAGARIPFDGKELTIAQLGPYKIDADRETRKAAYCAEGAFIRENGAKLDEIFDKLVQVRTKIAEALGEKSFVEVAYNRNLRNCYAKADVEAFRAQVVRDIVPIVESLKRRQSEKIGVPEMKLYDQNFFDKDGNAKPEGTSEEILAAGRRMYREMSPKTAEFIDFMFENELFDVLAKEGKAAGGYCTMLYEYKAPFIFSNFNGTSGDVDVLTHEAGHAFAFYESRNQPLAEYLRPTSEACEVHSMSMEFFCWKYLDYFYGGQTKKAKLQHLTDALIFLPYGTMVDHFQHIVYENPALTPVERNAEWLRLEEIYRPFMDVSGVPGYEDGRLWQRQLHIFEYPFYYIDYCLAQTVALEYWAMSQEDYGLAFEKYLAFLEQGGRMTFTELCAVGQVVSPFTEGATKKVVSAAKEWLAAND